MSATRYLQVKPLYRIESDSMGTIKVPKEALYGAQTARALEDFPVSGLRFPREFIRALGLIKKHAAAVNGELNLLRPELAEAIQLAATEVIAGKWDDQFVLDIFQTGSGTSTHMNANEVTANRASEILGGTRGDKKVHPNDHVNLGQSSNDVIPSAIHIAAQEQIKRKLCPALLELERALLDRATAFRLILKTGRTHLQDATPIRLGQEFQGYASQVEHGISRLNKLSDSLGELALGGTAVGTGMNTHPEFARRTIGRIARETGLQLWEAKNHFEAQAARDACVEACAVLKTIAISLMKVANDIRWLGSGPRCGLGELRLPSLQPGSSIMPGKVNPVMCEMLLQAGAQVIGNDATISAGNTIGSSFELNVMMPVIAYNLLQSIEILSNGSLLFAHACVLGLEADADHCADAVKRSLATCTALTPLIGYDAAAQIAREAYDSGRTIKEVARENTDLSEAQLDELLQPLTQTGSMV